ncbi:MAG: hypothetical protein DA328_05345 [Nitrososphaeraceae archaeon]|nr:hypothetical protein [Nitrososphaeraceae archaeon]
MQKKVREIVPVDIYRSAYEEISKMSLKRNISIRKFVNDLLSAAINKYSFLEKGFPHLQLDGIGKHSLYIKDYSDKEEKTAEVMVQEEYHLVCLLCKTNNCQHVHYSEVIPDIGHIILQENEKKIKDG